MTRSLTELIFTRSTSFHEGVAEWVDFVDRIARKTALASYKAINHLIEASQWVLRPGQEDAVFMSLMGVPAAEKLNIVSPRKNVWTTSELAESGCGEEILIDTKILVVCRLLAVIVTVSLTTAKTRLRTG